MKMELSFVWLSSTLIRTSKGGKSEIIRMVWRSGDSGDQENKMTKKRGNWDDKITGVGLYKRAFRPPLHW